MGTERVMRALLVAAAPVPGSATLVAELARSHDVVIAVDAGAAVCSEAGIEPDVVLGDFDSLDESLLTRFAARDVRIERFDRDKDATDLELACDEAAREGANEITVTCASAGRLDHTLAALGTLSAHARLRPALVEPSVRAWVLSPDGREQVMVAHTGALVSLLAFGAPAVVSATGVRWPLDREMLTPSSTRGVSNVVTSEAGAIVIVHEGVLLAIEPLRRAEERPITS